MSDKKVICPICDEEFDSIETVPEKCPVCETRKQEILQDLKEKEEGQITTFMVKDQASKVKEATEVKEEEKSPKGQVIVDEMIEDEESVDESIIFKEDKKSSSKNSVLEEEESSLYVMDKNETFVDDEEINVLFVEEEEKIKDLIRIEGQEENLNDVLEEEDVIFDKEEEDVIFDDKQPEDVIFDEDSKEPPKEEKKEKEEKKFVRSGASSLERFPLGFKYCTNCHESFPIETKDDLCNLCENAEPLNIYDKGFQPGHYLILYNDAKKAIGYFRLDNAGSVIIGRSSERGSLHDIDISLAWKNFYKKNCSEEEFKEKIRLVKGLSRKHALIRYLKEEEKYVLFHLSSKNYTIAYLPDGKKKQRGPNQRSPIMLTTGTLISFGNSSNHITLKFKKVELPK